MKRLATAMALALALTIFMAEGAQARSNCFPSLRYCRSALGVRVTGRVALKGRVAGLRLPGRGLIIKTPRGERTVYGLGPRWYWVRRGLGRPLLGERIKVEALRVKTPRGFYLVAYELKTPRGEILLRDPATGLPLWGRRYGAWGKRTFWRRTSMRW